MPKVFISYSHDTLKHKDRVLELSNRLRGEGVDCYIDQYEQSPAVGWATWCAEQIEEADFVLVACTDTYLQRFKKKAPPKIGKGVTWEGVIITQELYNNQGRNSKFIPIAFSPEDAEFVPITLQGSTLYTLSEGYDALYRHLTGQPLNAIPAVGKVKAMPPRERLAALPVLERKEEAIWQVPYAKNPFFTGREKILADVYTALAKRKSAALCGLGGVGKTRTAVEYAYRHRLEFAAVLWAKAEERSTLLSDFAAIAGALQLPSANAQEREVAVAEVRRWLNTHPGWLLILDNADDLDLAKEFLPTDGQGQVLLTTRSHALRGLADRIDVDTMEPEEGALLLLRRSGLIDRASASEKALALKISEKLGGLPLALDQAGAFIEETPSSLQEYLQLYNSVRLKLLSERGGSLGDHPSVTVTFSLAFETVARNSAAAADVVRLCAFLAPDAIPEVIFTDGAADLGENLSAIADDPLAFAKVLKEVGRFSLAERDTESKTLDIHRLVQVVVQGGMDEADQRVWAERAVRALNRSFPIPEFANWHLCDAFLPHARACASLVEIWALEINEAARLLNSTALYLHDRAQFGEAEQLYRSALAIWEKTLGPNHRDFATGLNNLGELYRRIGKFSEAEPCYRRSLSIREKILGPFDSDMAYSLNNLALLHYDQGNYTEAASLFQRCCLIWEKALGPDDALVAKSLGNLAEVFRCQKNFAEAEPLYKRSLAIREKTLGPQHPDVGFSLNNLALMYYGQDKYSEAEPLYQRSLAIWEDAFGPDHPYVGTNLSNLALLYSNQGRYSEAEPIHVRALAIREKALGRDHPEVAVSLNNLALVYYHQGRYSEAQPLFQRALEVYEKAVGRDHPNTKLMHANLEAIRTLTAS